MRPVWCLRNQITEFLKEKGWEVRPSLIIWIYKVKLTVNLKKRNPGIDGSRNHSQGKWEESNCRRQALQRPEWPRPAKEENPVQNSPGPHWLGVHTAGLWVFFFGFSGMWWHRDHRGLGSRSLRARKHSELPVSVRLLCFILFFFNLTQLYDFFVYLYSTSKVSLKAKKKKSKLLWKSVY